MIILLLTLLLVAIVRTHCQRGVQYSGLIQLGRGLLQNGEGHSQVVDLLQKIAHSEVRPTTLIALLDLAKFYLQQVIGIRWIVFSFT